MPINRAVVSGSSGRRRRGVGAALVEAVAEGAGGRRWVRAGAAPVALVSGRCGSVGSPG